MKKTMNVGVGKSKIEIPECLFPIEGFNSIHDDIHARILILSNKEKIAILSLELTSLQDYAMIRLKNLIHEATNIKKDNIWVCVTHSFSSPHIRSMSVLKKDPKLKLKNDLYIEAIEKAVAKATKKALDTIKEARVSYSNGNCDININRDIETNQGWWIGNNLEGISNKNVPIIAFHSKDNQLIAILYSYDVQSSILNHLVDSEGYKVISSDLVGKTSQLIETNYHEEVVVMYCFGAGADQQPYGKSAKILQLNDGLDMIDNLANRLSTLLLSSIQQVYKSNQQTVEVDKLTITCPGQVIVENISELKPTKEYNYKKAEDRIIDIEMIVLGDIVIVGMKPEICSITGMKIQKKSKFKQTMIVTLVNGGMKYMPDKESYKKITYEAMNSMFYQGAAEIVEEEVTHYLNKLKRRQLDENRSC